jgi:hypothetical protein
MIHLSGNVPRSLFLDRFEPTQLCAALAAKTNPKTGVHSGRFCLKLFATRRDAAGDGQTTRKRSGREGKLQAGSSNLATTRSTK